jgi:hypothetical protein
MEEKTLLQDPPVTTSSPVNPGNPPSNYLIGAILATLFCCQPLGIVSIIYAAQVNTKWQSGDLEGANRYSKNALMWVLISAGIGVVTISIALIFGLAAAFFENVC